MYNQFAHIPRTLLNQPPYALALIRGGPGAPNLRGEALFYPFLHGTLLLVRATGLPYDGFLGLHIHETGACNPYEGPAFSTAGGHYNPSGAAHPLHAGDLPPLLCSGGLAYATCYTGRFRPDAVVGRSVIIHAMPDDLHSQPAGDSGARIACGVIDRVSEMRG